MKRGWGLLALLLVTALVAAAVALESLDLSPPVGSDGGTAYSGSWYCPHGGGEGWSAAVEIANPGSGSAHVRVSGLGPEGMKVIDEFDLEPGAIRKVASPAGDRGSTAMVEYFDSWVAAGWVTKAGGEESGVAAEPCLPDAGKRFYMPDGTTQKGQQSYVVVMNPFGAEAVFTMKLQTGKEKPVTTTDLSDFVLKPGHSVAFHINQVTLEDTVAVELTATLGRVAAASLGVADAGGIRSAGGVTAAQPRWVLPGGLDNNSASVAVMNTTTSQAAIDASLYTDEGEQTAAGIEGQGLGAGLARTFSVITSSPSTIDVAASFAGDPGTAGVVATRRTFGVDGGDQGSTAGTTGPGAEWVVLPAVADAPYDVRLLIANPGEIDAEVDVALLGAEGARSSTKVKVPARRTVLVPVEFISEAPTDAVRVAASQGEVVPVMVGYSADHTGYAVSAGIPYPRWAAIIRP